MKNVILVKYGELALRGKNRHLFEKKLINALQKNLNNIGKYRVIREQGRILIEDAAGDLDFERVLPQIRTVLGIVAFCLCVKTDCLEMQHLKDVALQYMKKWYESDKFTFKVETRRADKRYPLNSREISADIGGYIFEKI